MTMDLIEHIELLSLEQINGFKLLREQEGKLAYLKERISKQTLVKHFKTVVTHTNNLSTVVSPNKQVMDKSTLPMAQLPLARNH